MARHANLVERALASNSSSVQTLMFDDREVPAEAPTTIHGATIASLNPGHLILAKLQYPKVFARSIRRVAVFVWDVDLIPRRLRLGFQCVDELWVPSTMGAEYLQRFTSREVNVIPTPILRPADQPFGAFRRQLGLGDKFLVAYMFDHGSSARRKNVEAAIRIYRSAFPRNTGQTHLILKCTRADTASADWGLLVEAAGLRSDISLVNEFWPQETIDAMYTDIDCYLSPHRSEGYGLTVADAVAHGVYVIATAYGGPMDFIPPDLFGMIPYRLVEVGRDPTYPARARWAEPSLDDGADLLREAFQKREEFKEKGRRARAEVLRTFTLENTARWISAQLNIDRVT